jgi:hypothetical protein
VTLKDVEVARLDPGRFQAVLDPDACRRFLGRLESAAERLGSRRLWQVNSTEQDGGVAEMLHFLVGYWLAPVSMPPGWCLRATRSSSRSPNASITCSTASR